MTDLEMFQRHAKTGVAIDTNVMLLLLIGNLDRAMIGRFKRVRQFVEEDFVRLSEFISRFNALATTPNILTEVSTLSRHGSISGQSPQRYLLAFRELVGLHDDERYFESRSLSGESSFAKFGLGDQSLIQLAQQNWLVLTDDFPLAFWLASKQLPVINFNHLRAYF